MRKTMLCIIVLAFSTPAFALSMMGAPYNPLKPKHVEFGLSYQYGELDLVAERYGTVSTIDSIEVSGEYLTVNGGILEDLSIYSIIGYNEFEKGSFSSDQDFTGGGGFKMTLGKHGRVTYGAIGQIMYADTELPHRGNVSSSGKVKSEADLYEIQLAVGSVYDCGNNIKIYCGPMVHFIDGRLDVTTSTGSKGAFDLKEDKPLGGFVGLEIGNIAIGDGIMSGNLEYQLTGSGWVAGGGIVIRY